MPGREALRAANIEPPALGPKDAIALLNANAYSVGTGALALHDAGLAPEAIGYVNAHGTATESGDVAESLATYRVFGDRAPISSLKSYLGHTLGAAGALEAWLTILMMRDDWVAPTLNLDAPDPKCAPLDYVRGEPRGVRADHVMSNNFAFGGVNTSLIFRRWPDPA